MPQDLLWEPKHNWYMRCVERANQHPIGSIEYCFWWSLRDELSKEDVIKQWAEDPKAALEGWASYFMFKYEQGASHRKARGEE